MSQTLEASLQLAHVDYASRLGLWQCGCGKIGNPPQVLRMLSNVPIVPQALPVLLWPCMLPSVLVWRRSSTARVPRHPCPSW